MPAPKDPEFRRRAIELARLREKPIAPIAKDLGIAESGLRRWMAHRHRRGQAGGLSSDEKAELVRLRRENRTQAMEIEILKRASAWPRTWPASHARSCAPPNRAATSVTVAPSLTTASTA